MNIMLKFLFHNEIDKMFVVCTYRKHVYYICVTELVNFVKFCLNKSQKDDFCVAPQFFLSYCLMAIRHNYD